MWILTTLMCVSMSPTEADCLKSVRPAVKTFQECATFIQPTRAFIEDLAEGQEANLLFLHVYCKRGVDL